MGQSRKAQDARGELLSMLVLALVIRPRTLKGNVENGIPGVMDTGEQEQYCGAARDEQRRYAIKRKRNRRDYECAVGDKRKDRIPEPVFSHRLVIGLAACASYHDK